MNKFLKVLTLALIALISFTNCRKIRVDEPDFSSSCKLSSLEMIYNGMSDGNVLFDYDAKGRMNKFTEGTTITSYTYETDKIGINIADFGNNEKIDYTLANGRIIKAVINDVATDYYLYSYDSDGYLSKITAYQNSVLYLTTTLSYSSGNLTRSITESSNTTTEVTYDYSTEIRKSNYFSNSPLTLLAASYILDNYFGKQAKNLLIKSTSVETYKPTGNAAPVISSSVNSYTYTKDAKGNIFTVTNTTVDTDFGGSKSTNVSKEVFAYNCN